LENLEEKQRGAGRKTEIKSGKRRHFLLKTIKAIEGKETNSLALCLVPKLNHHFAQWRRNAIQQRTGGYVFKATTSDVRFDRR